MLEQFIGGQGGMTLDKESQVTNVRLDEHGRLITQQGDRQNMQAARIDGLTLVVLGDEKAHAKGLLQRTKDLEAVTSEIQQWRHDIMIYARAGIAILTVTSLGTWLPYIREFLKLIGG